jgi:hypothetical protein
MHSGVAVCMHTMSYVYYNNVTNYTYVTLLMTLLLLLSDIPCESLLFFHHMKIIMLAWGLHHYDHAGLSCLAY